MRGFRQRGEDVGERQAVLHVERAGVAEDSVTSGLRLLKPAELRDEYRQEILSYPPHVVSVSEVSRRHRGSIAIGVEGVPDSGR